MSLYICSNCHYGSASWMGKCPDCGQWNTFQEQASPASAKTKREKTQPFALTPIAQIKTLKQNRLVTQIHEFDRVLGGGILPGAVILLTGEPGVGKSTLLLQALQKLKTVYVSGEESAGQVKDRADRLKINLANFFFSDTTQVEGMLAGLEKMKERIELVVIDSIQTVYSKTVDAPAGNVSQLKESANQISEFAKRHHLPVILVGHITKEGDIAGPKTLEHLVDCVLTFEGERLSHFRILRAGKNRFGATDEIGIFVMKDRGLEPVNNPVAFINRDEAPAPGKAIAGVVEGKRPLFFELQTLTVPTQLALPRRVVKGVDYNRLQLLIAVLRKHLNLSLDRFDVFVNVVGGVTIRSTAVDLAVAASLLSSLHNFPLPPRSVFSGEIGLLGEVRPAFFQDKLIGESKRLAFRAIYSSLNLPHVRALLKLITASRSRA
ncbi:DNA repair protein RadA [Patescibacteria group bacterium]|nr:DNA repair protein RadA [Patescibacteria group bacterium]MCL5091647.1 DNA repair protein RadA [Patescibacteria group bacterium]